MVVVVVLYESLVPLVCSIIEYIVVPSSPPVHTLPVLWLRAELLSISGSMLLLPLLFATVVVDLYWQLCEFAIMAVDNCCFLC